MSGYIGTQPVPQATQKRQAFTATAGQTTFATSGYSVGFVDVYMNGVKLAAADYTATNGSDVVLATAALVNDIIETVSFTSFVASDGLAVANNLSDVASASTSRTNLGITLPNLGVTSTAAELNQLDAITRGSILYGNASGATARLAKGAAGTVLTSDGTDLSFAAVAAGADDVVWPSNLASPNNTYTASGTWSKGSLDDDDYVWIYLVGGGQGGRSSSSYLDGTVGGAALLIYGKAKFFNGGAYVVGAGTAGSSTASDPALGAASTFTTTSTHGSTIFTTADAVAGSVNQPSPSATLFNTFTGAGTKQPTTNIVAAAPRTHDFILGTPITGWAGITSATTHWNFGQASNGIGQNGIFGGGAGGAIYSGGARAGGGSLYAGAGGASSGDGANQNGTAGTVPGGAGGAGGSGTSVGGAGANGNVRVYHV